MTASNTAFTVFSGIALVLSLIPLWWHLESRNIGTCAYMIWTALACLVHFVDSILWSGNTINKAPVWCDIAIRIQIAVAVAWPACILCIIRRLYKIACPVTSSNLMTEKRRELIIDLSITIGIPVLQMCLEYIVAGHRFNIVEDFGCAPATYNTPLTYFLVESWPLVIGAASACYGVLATRAFLKRRKEFSAPTANTSLTYNRYWRLVALASVDFCFTIPLAIRSLVMNLLLGVNPWISWADTHSGYSRVEQIPRIVLDQYPIVAISLEINRWSAVLCAFVFFAFFGFADEARKNYCLLVSTITKRLAFAEGAATSYSMGKRSADSGVDYPPMTSKNQIKSVRDSDSVDTSPEEPPYFVLIGDYDVRAQPSSPRNRVISSSGEVS